MSWTDERVDLLARLWGEGLSASQIAGQLGGVTRNAVIGKVHRLKLEGRVKTVAQDVAKKAVAAAEPDINETIVEIEMQARTVLAQPMLRSLVRPMGGGMQGAAALKMEPDEEFIVTPEPARPMVAGEVVPISRNLTLVQLSDRTCKWPLGDPLSPDFRFCGNHSNDASPYCQYHAKIAFQPVSERRRAR